jgi:hypothetical protein
MTNNYEVEKKNENLGNQSQIAIKSMPIFMLNIDTLRKDNEKTFDETEIYSCIQEKKNNENEQERPLNTEGDKSLTVVNESQNYSQNPYENEKIKTDKNSIYNINLNTNLPIYDIYSQATTIEIQNYFLIEEEKKNDCTFTIPICDIINNNIIENQKTGDMNEDIEEVEINESDKKTNFIDSKIVENNDVDLENIINLDSILSGKETRTVVRLNPIPQHYSRFDVCKLLDKYLQIESGKNQRIYKALYIPRHKVTGKNSGYCFVMMVKPKYVIDFYKTFYKKSFGKKKCKKPYNVIWADIQGENFLKASKDDPINKPMTFKDIKMD